MITSKLVEIVRTANPVAYTANDAVSDSDTAPTVIDFSSLVKTSNGEGYIVKAQLATDQKANTARFRLHLFNVVPAAIKDNLPYGSLYENFANRVGTIDFPALSTEDSTSSTKASSIATPGTGNLPLAFSGAGLYGLLETLDAFTPASGQKISIRLTAEG